MESTDSMAIAECDEGIPESVANCNNEYIPAGDVADCYIANCFNIEYDNEGMPESVVDCDDEYMPTRDIADCYITNCFNIECDNKSMPKGVANCFITKMNSVINWI